MSRIHAPEWRGTGGWIGTSAPLSLSLLRGKIVVLDFWTSCCINCVRVQAELRPIEQRFADEVVVIGIHSPKFPREHDHDAVRAAVQRLGITHAVLDDPDMETWEQYAITGWPTLVVIDPEGYVVGGVSGEGCGAVLSETIERLVAVHAADATLVRGRLFGLSPIADGNLGGGGETQPPLRFPGKVAVRPDGERLAISDTGHDRVLVCDLEGRVELIVSPLRAPQGVRFDGDRLVICETGADRIVAAPLDGGPRTILAANLASPWDLVVEADGALLVAEAGRHRLWRVRDGAPTELVAGTGEENLVDGPAASALLAQPSGLAPFAGGVAFVDAESSALRVWSDGRVRTLVGQGLFDWGASDGGVDSAAMQHPLGVAATSTGDSVYVADTFNSLIRSWRADEPGDAIGTLSTLPVTDLCEPGGLDVLPDGRLVIADTNNHRVVIAKPDRSTAEELRLDESFVGSVEGDVLASRSQSVLRVPYAVDPAGMQLDVSGGLPVQIDVRAVPPALLAPGPRRWEFAEPEGSIELLAGTEGSGTVVVTVEVALCDDTGCTVARAATRHPFRVQA